MSVPIDLPASPRSGSVRFAWSPSPSLLRVQDQTASPTEIATTGLSRRSSAGCFTCLRPYLTAPIPPSTVVLPAPVFPRQICTSTGCWLRSNRINAVLQDAAVVAHQPCSIFASAFQTANSPGVAARLQSMPLIFHLPSGRWIPHSVFSRPRQRPARMCSPGATRSVHGMQPMERNPSASSG
jgi:hypothetical protein